jgi:16S rRNA (adenine1518-N6/adenine1519-N6)-dimethyltransferase
VTGPGFARDPEELPAGSGGGGRPAASGLRQVSLARLTEFSITPKRDLGQNFLIDDNILGVILGQLECRPDDVVLEVGAGLGVLTAALAEVAHHVQAFEIDKSLEAPLTATLRDRAVLGHDHPTPGCDHGVSLRFQDILKARLEELDPMPTLCASNLPYSVAGPFVIEALQRLPSVRRYCVMVQREVAERMAASPGTKTYGILSVWVQLYARITRTRPLGRSIFFPRPNVDSSLMVFDRLPASELPSCDAARLRAVVQAAFGQRRKTLANALSAGLGLPREQVLAMITSLGLPADIRAERLAPRQFVELANQG